MTARSAPRRRLQRPRPHGGRRLRRGLRRRARAGAPAFRRRQPRGLRPQRLCALLSALWSTAPARVGASAWASTKALVSVRGEPLIAWHMRMLREVEDVVVVVGYQASKVIEAVRRSAHCDLRLQPRLRRPRGPPQAWPRATAGAPAISVPRRRPARAPRRLRGFRDAPGPCLGVAPATRRRRPRARRRRNGSRGGRPSSARRGPRVDRPAARARRPVAEAAGHGGASGHVYEMLTPHLPIPARQVRAREIDTPEDYDRAMEWLEPIEQPLGMTRRGAVRGFWVGRTAVDGPSPPASTATTTSTTFRRSRRWPARARACSTSDAGRARSPTAGHLSRLVRPRGGLRRRVPGARARPPPAHHRGRRRAHLPLRRAVRRDPSARRDHLRRVGSRPRRHVRALRRDARRRRRAAHQGAVRRRGRRSWSIRTPRSSARATSGIYPSSPTRSRCSPRRLRRQVEDPYPAALRPHADTHFHHLVARRAPLAGLGGPRGRREHQRVGLVDDGPAVERSRLVTSGDVLSATPGARGRREAAAALVGLTPDREAPPRRAGEATRPSSSMARGRAAADRAAAVDRRDQRLKPAVDRHDLVAGMITSRAPLEAATAWSQAGPNPGLVVAQGDEVALDAPEHLWGVRRSRRRRRARPRRRRPRAGGPAPSDSA